jgi:hypothetical protein
MNYRQEWDGERSALESRSQFGRSNGDGPELLSPDEARAHMQEVTRFLQGIPGSSTKPVRPKRA